MSALRYNCSCGAVSREFAAGPGMARFGQDERARWWHEHLRDCPNPPPGLKQRLEQRFLDCGDTVEDAQ